MPTFVLNDETKTNSYGFRIPNSGIDFGRFDANPVMLDEHWNSTTAVLGLWSGRKIEGPKLVADSKFDTEDADTAKIAGKVDRGFIRGCSMGVTFDPDYMVKGPDGVFELTQCELYEASICAIPSNANAIQLFTKAGELIPEDQVKLTLSTLKNDKPEIKIPEKSMKKLALTAATLLAVGLTSDSVESPEDILTVSNAIAKLYAENTALATSKKELETSLKEANGKLTLQAESNAKAMVATAVLEGKITADLSAEFEKMAVANPELTAKVIAGMPGKKSLSAQLGNKSAGTSANAGEVKTLEDFQKLPLDKQLAFKAENGDAYKALFS